mmetsp:Transcript_28353/g.71379  ORF Transcript_28353/g.71379 Transcript_28353/m.71379 type:complete len:80 (+) Transcript_28353:48-287(+)
MKELQRFILRTATLALYRHALRSARSLAPAHAAPHLRAEIRARFSERAREVDGGKIMRLQAEAKKEIELLEGMLRSGKG